MADEIYETRPRPPPMSENIIVEIEFLYFLNTKEQSYEDKHKTKD
jgi:hypothetical protein